jgi:hypothetical protein
MFSSSMATAWLPEPTSAMYMRPETGSIVIRKGLRSPSAQISSRLEPAPSKNGLSVGIVPSLLIRRILPRGTSSRCESAAVVLSPVEM